MSKDFGAFLSQLRRNAGLTQVDLANLTGVNNSLISYLESGKISTSYTTASSVAENLNIPPEEKARFYLLAFGCPEEEVDTLLMAIAKDPEATHTIKEIKKLIDRH